VTGLQKKRGLRDLSPAQRAALGVAAAVQIGLIAAAQRDIRRRPAHRIRGHKRLWTAAAFVNYVGPIAYFLFGRRR
jgi:hypothetical protein